LANSFGILPICFTISRNVYGSWGTVIGAIFGSIPTNKLGRKKTLIIIGLLFFISALGSAFAAGPISFAFFRLSAA